MTESQQITDGQTYTSSYQYDFGGRLVQETYPSGRIVKNDFEADGDLSRIYGKANPNATERTYANSFSYTPDGKIEKLKLGNGRWEWAKFNERLQVTELALGSGVTDASLWKLKYEYGELNTDGTVNTTKNTGNIAKQTLSFNGLAQPFVQTFKYDSLYRLIEARETSNSNQTWKEAFSYDRFGNRIGFEKFIGTTQLTLDNKTHPTIDPNTNRFNANQGYSYDKNGNLIQDAEGRSFTFNGENKQGKIEKNGNKVGEYFYDGEGKRIKKKVYDSVGVLTEETVFVYSAGKLVAEYSTTPAPPNPTTKWTATDQLGSPRVITDSNGNVVSRRDFMPFGEEIVNNLALNDRPTNLKYGTSDGIRQKFTGYQKDEETQLDFAEARMYENRHGRFTTVDPLLASGKSANPQTFNRYVYCLNNPLVLTDPNGLQTGTKGYWTYRDFKNENDEDVRSFRYFTSEVEQQTYEGVWGRTYTKWTGNNIYLWKGSGIYLADSGNPTIFPLAKLSEETLKGLYAAQESGQSFSEEQQNKLKGLVLNEVQKTPDYQKGMVVASLGGPGLAAAAERGILSCATRLPSFPGFTSNPAPRGPIFADTNLLINAEKGNIAALNEIRSGMTYVTPNQYREFLNVSTSAQRTSRLSFLQNNGVTLFGGPQAGVVAQTPIFQSTFRASLVQGRGDSALGAFSRTTGFTAVTAENTLLNFYTKSCPQLGVPIRRIP